MLKISDVSIDLDQHDYKGKIASMLNLRKSKIHHVKLVKQAIDARRKNHVHFNCAFTFETENEAQVIKNNPKKKLSVVKDYHYPLLKPHHQKVVVVGSGPAGLFCAYNLARSGQKVTLIERGKPVDQRKKDIDTYLNTGKLNIQSNVQFGEGGAGTFSDGKLTTGVKDYRARFILETFVKHGAHDDILYLNKPHIGTDVLIEVVKNMREYIINHQGEVLFETTLTDINIENNKIESIVMKQNNEMKVMAVDQLVLAIGHSARDTYQMLYQKGINMDAKAFAVGLRIEHLQQFINEHQYGRFANHPALKAADYKLAVKTSDGRGVYSFCMCPGGEVMNASSEIESVVVNGMSNYKRDGKFANSAILVTVNPSDFKDDHPLAGIAFQRQLEHLAFILGGKDYSVPVQKVEDYLNDTFNEEDVECSVKRIKYAPLNELFPSFLNKNLKEGLALMNQKFSGFTSNALLLGVESRSSAPVRFERHQDYQSNIEGIYPIGEGAGYAGGIMSSAIDGLKCSEMLMRGNDKCQ